MSLMSDIQETIKETKQTMTKRDKILSVKNEIRIMLEKKIPLLKQIELITKNDIVSGIDVKYYRKILKEDFGYMTNKKTNKKVSQNTPKKETKIKSKTKQDSQNNKTATEMLSQSIELKF